MTPRELKPDPTLTKELRVTLQICATLMHSQPEMFDLALTNPATRTALKQRVEALATIIDAIRVEQEARRDANLAAQKQASEEYERATAAAAAAAKKTSNDD